MICYTQSVLNWFKWFLYYVYSKLYNYSWNWIRGMLSHCWDVLLEAITHSHIRLGLSPYGYFVLMLYSHKTDNECICHKCSRETLNPLKNTLVEMYMINEHFIVNINCKIIVWLIILIHIEIQIMDNSYGVYAQKHRTNWIKCVLNTLCMCI